MKEAESLTSKQSTEKGSKRALMLCIHKNPFAGSHCKARLGPSESAAASIVVEVAHGLEIGMSHGVFGRDAFCVVVSQHLAQQVESFV